MSELFRKEVRTFLVELIDEQLSLKGYSARNIPDDFDLLSNGVIDSLSFLELTVALQEEFEVEFDFDEIDPEELSHFGSLCQYTTRKRKENFTTQPNLNFANNPMSG